MGAGGRRRCDGRDVRVDLPRGRTAPEPPCRQEAGPRTVDRARDGGARRRRAFGWLCHPRRGDPRGLQGCLRGGRRRAPRRPVPQGGQTRADRRHQGLSRADAVGGVFTDPRPPMHHARTRGRRSGRRGTYRMAGEPRDAAATGATPAGAAPTSAAGRGTMPAAAHARRATIAERVARLGRHGARRAYLWREGVRWRSRTYAELAGRVHGAARTLRAAGLKPGDPVLLQGPDHPDAVEAILGAFLAGGVVVPLEGATQAPFRDSVARTVGARLFVAGGAHEAPPGCTVIPLGSWGVSDPEPAASVTTAEIVFTSGTTGEPKGVVLTHDNLAADFAPVEAGFRGHERLLGPLGELPVLSSLPLSHMFGQAMNMFLPLYMGLTVALVPPRPRDILDAAPRLRAWGLFTVPRLLELMAAEMRRAHPRPEDRARLEARLERHAGRPFWMQALLFPSMRRQLGWRFLFVVSGGAALTDPVRECWERCGYLVVQGYGLTETAPIISISNPFRRGRGNVGKALAGQEVRLGPGGEILVRGANVTPGYVGAGVG